MATQTAPSGTGTTLDGFDDRMVVQLQQAEALLQRFEARARKIRLNAQIARAKADIDAAAAALKTSLDEFGRKFSTHSDASTRKEH